MQYDFLKQFTRRMKHIGMYTWLIQNSVQKQSWKQYGLLTVDEQMNMIAAVMLYIMEQSLREDTCTIDDIGAYIDDINMNYFQKNMSYEDCKTLGDFIVNVVLSNEGKTMYFESYDFKEQEYKKQHISFIANRIIYVDTEIRRTSYYLTDDGYNFLLSTLEIENNMKLTIHEMIFKMHLERQSYDKAVGEIKNIFNLLRIQWQKIQETMQKIRRSALNYSVKEYEAILREDMDTISDTKEKFQNYRELVRAREKELEEQNINVKNLTKEEENSLSSLRIIEQYLNRTIDEHQRILNGHFDLKSLYDRELQMLTQMSLIRRFSFRTELFEPVLEKPEGLENLDVFLRPLFHQETDKIYNLNKALELQRPIRKKQIEDDIEILDLDEENWKEELERQKKEKQRKYESSLGFLISCALDKGKISLQELKEYFAEHDREEQHKCIPDVDTFKEIMVELIKSKEINVPALKKERSQFIIEQSEGFQLQEMLLDILDHNPRGRNVNTIMIYRTENGETVTFEHVMDQNGMEKAVRCSNVQIEVTYGI